MAPNPQRLAQSATAKKAARDPKKIAKLRRICMAYPGVVEVEQFGEPWWKAGKKPFCSCGAENNRDGAAFNVSLMDQAELVKDPRFEKTHYIGQHGWTTLTFDGRAEEWDEVAELVDIAYRRVASKALLKELDEVR